MKNWKENLDVTGLLILLVGVLIIASYSAGWNTGKVFEESENEISFQEYVPIERVVTYALDHRTYFYNQNDVNTFIGYCYNEPKPEIDFTSYCEDETLFVMHAEGKVACVFQKDEELTKLSQRNQSDKERLK